MTKEQSSVLAAAIRLYRLQEQPRVVIRAAELKLREATTSLLDSVKT
jgi:hypothetical protein